MSGDDSATAAGGRGHEGISRGYQSQERAQTKPHAAWELFAERESRQEITPDLKTAVGAGLGYPVNRDTCKEACFQREIIPPPPPQEKERELSVLIPVCAARDLGKPRYRCWFCFLIDWGSNARVAARIGCTGLR